MAMDATPNAILRLRSGERTQPGGLRDGGRGCITAAQAGLANRASQAERKRVPSGIPRILTYTPQYAPCIRVRLARCSVARYMFLKLSSLGNSRRRV